jgi:hypothetical protein
VVFIQKTKINLRRNKMNKKNKKEVNENLNLTEIICVIDRSGSMSSIKDDAIGGFNSFLKEQQELPGEAKLTLVLFDDQYDIIYEGVPIEDVKPLTEKTYIPRGMTALLDAVGKTVNTVSSRIASSKDITPQVVVAILTDGAENCSKEYTREQITDSITKYKEKRWEFVFLAANQDAIQSGGSIGIDANRSCNFIATGAGIAKGFSGMSASIASYRSTGSIDNVNWSNPQDNDDD